MTQPHDPRSSEPDANDSERTSGFESGIEEHECARWELDRRVFLGVSTTAVAAASWWGITARADAQATKTRTLSPPTAGSQNYAYDE